MTHNIANMGFRGLRRFVARIRFLCNRIVTFPKTLTGHIVVIGNFMTDNVIGLVVIGD
jgi:hypothetical protein